MAKPRYFFEQHSGVPVQLFRIELWALLNGSPQFVCEHIKYGGRLVHEGICLLERACWTLYLKPTCLACRPETVRSIFIFGEGVCSYVPELNGFLAIILVFYYFDASVSSSWPFREYFSSHQAGVGFCRPCLISLILRPDGLCVLTADLLAPQSWKR